MRWLPVAPPESWQHDSGVLREFLTAHNLSGAQAGALLGVDGRTVRKWTGNERAMPYSAWFCLVHRASSPLS